MATRFYLQSVTTPPNTPGFAAWDRTTEAIRRTMVKPRVSSTMTSFTIWANGAVAASANALCAQFSSRTIKVGTVFATTDTIKMQIRCQESSTNDNINRQPICVKVYNGNTLQATLVALGHIGPNTNEWLNTGLRNKTAADGDLLTGLGGDYTTVSGDYLVVEIGGQVSTAGGSSVTGTLSIGSDHATTDLAENETDTTAFNPWFEISTTFVFDTIMDAAPGSYALSGAATTNLRGKVINAAPGVYTITGAATTNVKGKALDAASGSYTLTGAATTNLRSKVINAAPGVYTITGAATTNLRSKVINAAPGAYTLSGFAATILQNQVINAAPGSYSITGAATTLLHSQIINASSGSYTLTGAATTNLRSKVINAAPGSYALTGSSATELKNSITVANPGSYSASGQAATLLHSQIINAASGSYTVTGFSADLLKQSGAARFIVAASGSYIISGASAGLLYQPIAVPSGGYDAALMRRQWDEYIELEDESVVLGLGPPP